MWVRHFYEGLLLEIGLLHGITGRLKTEAAFYLPEKAT